MEESATVRDAELIPRLTKSLRSFCAIPTVEPWNERRESARGSGQSLETSSAVEYKKLKGELCAQLDAKGFDSRKIFKTLEEGAVNLLPAEARSDVNLTPELTLKVLNLLENYNSSMGLSKRETEQLQRGFSVFRSASANSCGMAVAEIRESIGADLFHRLLVQHDRSGRNRSRPHRTETTAEVFQPELTIQLPTLEDCMVFETVTPRLTLFNEEREIYPTSEIQEFQSSSMSKKPNALDTVQLLECLKKSFDEPDTIMEMLMSHLTSTKTDDQLQMDLFELLGPDHLDLIGRILSDRKSITEVYTITDDEINWSDTNTVAKSSGKYHKNGTRDYSDRSMTGKAKGPYVGQQIVVQSESELQMGKVLRKEEKKFMKGGRGTAFNSNCSDDVDALRKRELAFEAAKSAPLFGRELEPQSYSAPQYPFVFDNYTAAKKSAAFIAGVKLSIPEGFHRNDNRKYEEVIIDPVTPARSPSDPGHNRITIAQLDPFAQPCFVGTKQLNQIQTVVYPAAFKSNENLLICAPTGAGKTNIAMLCILHTVKQFMVGDVLQRDKFKIVYVAPMKALAAEMVRNFGSRLKHLGIVVKELTGDMQLTKMEILQTQMLITTPEKWDVVTRKATGDNSLSQLVKLLIIDEIHLLHDDRGPVLETLVARTLRQVNSQQSMIRIVGLSATLPNYENVAEFLRVNKYRGLFFFDGRFRPVPLGQRFVGVKAMDNMTQMTEMDEICYDKALEFIKEGHQVMVFVHSRNATGRVAGAMRDIASNRGDSLLFRSEDSPQYGSAQKQIRNSKNRQLQDLFEHGFAIHHAGMLRHDRTLVENYFRDGYIRVLVCTSTLAWGVNLPAHAVIIRGTEIYDANRGSFVDLGILDVQQIFGRAGRPQYDKVGYGTIITSHKKLAHYLSVLTRQLPIESQLIDHLADCLNAEVCLNTVSTIEEALEWIRYTFLFVRMQLNPLAYGVPFKVSRQEGGLLEFIRDLIHTKALKLDLFRMIRYNEKEGTLFPTDRGRTASHYYIKCDTMEIVNDSLREFMTEADILALISSSTEFEQLKVRDDELDELENLYRSFCQLPVKGGPEHTPGKVNILLQGHISKARLESFSLISDSGYVVKNASRIARGLFDLVLKLNWSLMIGRMLKVCKMIELQMWEFSHPLRQFYRDLGEEILEKLERKKVSLDYIHDADPSEIGAIVNHMKMGAVIKHAAEKLPSLEIIPTVQPITRTVLKIHLTVKPDFVWDDKFHGKGTESFYIWIEDPDTNFAYHTEYFLIHRKQVKSREEQTLVFTVPIAVADTLPTQYILRCSADRWMGTDATIPVSFQHLILPQHYPPQTELLDLQPLPIQALKNPKLEALYRFSHFNAVQTQIFFCLYHTDNNVLIGAPTGSGKTIAAELAFFRAFREYPKSKCVYIAPLKALVRERMLDWKDRLEKRLGKRVVELTGDLTPDVAAINAADVIVTTPEKWDGISRSWQNRNYVRDVSVIVIDEIHLLGEGRGPVLEVVVSRTNFIRAQTERPVRIVGLSTALANARDLADWLNIDEMGLYNFKASVRPVPMTVHMQGFPGKHYCPRMATMNKPAFQAIKTYSPTKPSLIFVSSRRQTRLTAFDLVAFLAVDANPKCWLHMEERDMEQIIRGVREENLKLTLSFGIGIHHAGLHENDRKIVEELFVNQKIQVLIATATLAWGVNFPAHLVVIKGTEFYDGKTKRYVDMPITDVLQMMGRAGRPQFDDEGVAVVFVQDVKKNFYKKFLYEPFPVESSLLEVLPDHLNAEIVAGTITSKQTAIDYLMWTYLFRRLLQNPSYYHLENVEAATVNKYLENIVDTSLNSLSDSFCISVMEDNRTVVPSTLGRIASYYYLSHNTVKMFRCRLNPTVSVEELLKVLADAPEYDEIPVRHNEDIINGQLCKSCPLAVDTYALDSSHTKTHLLFQSHFSRLPLPSSDYLTDSKSVLDQAIRIIQALLDVAAEEGWLVTSLRIVGLLQMVIQGRWLWDPSVSTLPHIDLSMVPRLLNGRQKVEHLSQMLELSQGDRNRLDSMLRGLLDPREQQDLRDILETLPVINASISVQGWWEGDYRPSNKNIPFTDTGANRYWTPVHADMEYLIAIDLRRLNQKKDSKAHLTRFHKPKDEGWIVIVGCPETQEVIALKRVGFVAHKSSTKLVFRTPSVVGRLLYRVYLMSDCYLGLDQQFDVQLDVIEASIEAQVNAELEV